MCSGKEVKAQKDYSQHRYRNSLAMFNVFTLMDFITRVLLIQSLSTDLR